MGAAQRTDRMTRRQTYWTHVRVSKRTKANVQRLKALLTEAYQEGRSPMPLRNADHGASDDETIAKAVDFMLEERERKNQPKRLRRQTTEHANGVLTQHNSNHHNGDQ